MFRTQLEAGKSPAEVAKVAERAKSRQLAAVIAEILEENAGLSLRRDPEADRG